MRQMRLSPTAAAMLLIKSLVTSSAVLAAGDPSAGQTVFAAHCAVCHSTEPGVNKIGPSLAGIPCDRSTLMAARTPSTPVCRTKFVINPHGLLSKTV